MKDGCPFCMYEGPSRILKAYDGAYVIKPLLQVVPGHLLIVSYEHVTDAADEPAITAVTFAAAGELAAELHEPFNLITSCGHAATQTVPHLHVHYLPRYMGDGVMLPWGYNHG